MIAFKLQRLGTVMQPEPGNALEIEGVLNPAAVRGPDGELYLFPRMVAKGNYSRIGIARVKFNEAGDPVGVERLGIALEPEAEYELRPDGGGGCEDPRISYIESLQYYIMTYIAFSPSGPRIAMAQSKDLFKWERLGLAKYLSIENMDFNALDDKDASLFPIDIPSPLGHSTIAILHRPHFPENKNEEPVEFRNDTNLNIPLDSIWISYSSLPKEDDEDYKKSFFIDHHPLAQPVSQWEKIKIGAGTPPVMTRHGWMILYHGVQEVDSIKDTRKLIYSAGVMVLSEAEPCKILYRSTEPVFKPDSPDEMVGTISNVVFPTGIDCRHDLGKPDRFDVYYGMADDRIGVAKMEIPELLPSN